MQVMVLVILYLPKPHQLLENIEEIFVIDNEALFNVNHNVLKQKQSS